MSLLPGCHPGSWHDVWIPATVTDEAEDKQVLAPLKPGTRRVKPSLPRPCPPAVLASAA